MTYKEKYEDLDRSKLPEKAIVIIDTMKKDSKGFTDTEALEIVGPKFDQVIAKLKASGYEEAFKSMQKKAPEPKTPVAKAKKIVQQAVKQPKTTSTKAKPTVGAFKKGAVGELAKQIRKDGEAWPSALKRAGQMIKEQKSGVQKKATAQYKKLTALLAKMPELGKGTDIERDSPRKAKPIGKRTAKSGNTYYEYRANRTDVRQGKGYPYLKLGAMLAKGGEIEKIYDKVQMFDEITEKEISAIVKKMNDAKGPKNFDAELQKMVDWVWDNEPRLSKEQSEKGGKFLKNIAFMANGKSRSNSPFGSREEYTLKNLTYIKLRGFHDVSLYGRVEQYVPLYTVYDDEGYGFEYFYHNGKVNVVGEKGMTIKKKSKVDVDFFDSDKKVQDFLNLSKVQFLARYKETKERYQQMVNAITRNIEGVFMHGGKMGGAGQFADGGKIKSDILVVKYSNPNKNNDFDETGDVVTIIKNGKQVFSYDPNNKELNEVNININYPNKTKLIDFLRGSKEVSPKDYTPQLIRVIEIIKNNEYGHRAEDEVYEIKQKEEVDLVERIKDFDRNVNPRPKTKGDKVRAIFVDFQKKGYSIDEINTALGEMNYAEGGMMADGGMNSKIVMLVKDKKGNVVLRTTSTNKAADYVSLHGRDNFTVETLDGRRIIATGGLTNLEGTTTPKAYPMGEPDINVVV